MDAVVDVRRPKDVGAVPARVLVVEDHEVNIIVIVELTKHVARDLGLVLDISVARTAREAASRWRDERPDVVLLDINLPDGRGDQVSSQMTQDVGAQSKPFVVCVTASGEDLSPDNLRAAGIDQYLAKPVRSDALLESLKGWSELRAAAAKARRVACCKGTAQSLIGAFCESQARICAGLLPSCQAAG